MIKLTPPQRRLAVALACYAVLALIGALALDGILRGAVLCLMALLAFKTIMHAKDEEMHEPLPDRVLGDSHLVGDTKPDRNKPL